MHHKLKIANEGFFLVSDDMEKKTASANARISAELRRRLDAIHEKHLTNDATVLNRTLEAFCDYVEKAGAVRLPFEIVPTETKAEAKAPTRRAS